MRARRELGALAVGLMAGLAAVAAAPATAQTWAVTVPAGGGAVQSSDLQTNATNTVTGDTATVEVTCQSAADCAKVQLRLAQGGNTVLPLGRMPAGSNTFPVPASVLRGTVMDLDFSLNGADLGSFKVTAAATGTSGTTGTTGAAGTTGVAGTTGAPGAAGAAGTTGSTGTAGTAGAAASSGGGSQPSLGDLLTTACDPLTVTIANGQVCVSGAAPNLTIGYDEKANCGAMVVTPAGNVLARAVDTFDENDELRVIVYGDVKLLPTLKVERTSGFRDVQTVRIVGAGETVPSQLLTRQGSDVCSTAEFRLNDFSPGEGKFQISSYQGNAWTPLGSGDFNVDPLYTGMFSLGAAWTDLVDPGYKVATNGSGDSVIALGDDGSNDLLYSLFYTPFVWGKRDLEKSIPWYRHINPTFGIVPQEIEDNAMIGVTVDLPQGLLFTFGRHFRRITVLPADTGLTVGSSFSGTSDEIPTANKWEDDNFFAVTIDLRAAVQLFTAAFGSSSSSSGSSN